MGAEGEGRAKKTNHIICCHIFTFFPLYKFHINSIVQLLHFLSPTVLVLIFHLFSFLSSHKQMNKWIRVFVKEHHNFFLILKTLYRYIHFYHHFKRTKQKKHSYKNYILCIFFCSINHTFMIFFLVQMNFVSIVNAIFFCVDDVFFFLFLIFFSRVPVPLSLYSFPPSNLTTVNEINGRLESHFI